MSLQDESFPHDDLLSLSDYSQASNSIQLDKLVFSNVHASEVATNKNVTEQIVNNLASYSSSSDQNVSDNSNVGQTSSSSSHKTTASDPIGLAENSKKILQFVDKTEDKFLSCQDLTLKQNVESKKNRFAHVKSKVGQYIADMKAEDEKRRTKAKFQRHRSLPEYYSHSNGIENLERTELIINEKRRASAAEISSTDVDIDTTSTNRSSELTGTCSSGPSTSTSASHDHESSEGVDDVESNGLYMDRQTFVQLLAENKRLYSLSNYLETNLNEKNGEILRLKRNVDNVRIELLQCKDQLKKVTKQSKGASLPLLTSMDMPMISSKGTQTEVPATPALLARAQSLFLPSTPRRQKQQCQKPDSSSIINIGNLMGRAKAPTLPLRPLALNFSNTAESNNDASIRHGNGSSSSDGLRQRSNAMVQVRADVSNAIHNSRSCSSCPSSNDSAIDIEAVEMASPNRVISAQHNHQQQPEIHRLEIIYHDKINQTNDSTTEHNISSVSTTVFITSSSSNNLVENRKHSTHRRRWLRFLSNCASCSYATPNRDQSFQNSPSVSYTAIPLLEQKLPNNGNADSN